MIDLYVEGERYANGRVIMNSVRSTDTTTGEEVNLRILDKLTSGVPLRVVTLTFIGPISDYIAYVPRPTSVSVPPAIPNVQLWCQSVPNTMEWKLLTYEASVTWLSDLAAFRVDSEVEGSHLLVARW